MARWALDASALLSLIGTETGADIVSRALLEGDAVISWVNPVETLTRLSDTGRLTSSTVALIDTLGVEVVSFDREQALSAVRLRTVTKHRVLSLGDRACLALSLALDAEVLTADRAWGELAVGVRVRLIR